MNTDGTELHPNWRALSTLHIPLKRFIAAGKSAYEVHSVKEKHAIENVNGEEAQQFYEEVLKVSHVHDAIKTETPKKQQKIQTKTPFSVKLYFQAAMSNNMDELKKMNLKDGDLDVQDNYGWTALMMAACEGATQVVTYLIELGVKRDILNKSNLNAADLARKKGFPHIAQLIENPHVIEPKKHPEIVKLEPFFCETCQQTFKDTTKKDHCTSIIHQVHNKSDLPINPLRKFNIPPNNRGLQLMLKQGWDRASGLGPTQNGNLYPIKTVVRKQRSGLGIAQDPARVTHFGAFDLRATRRQTYKKARNRNDIRREKVVEWKRARRLRQELS